MGALIGEPKFLIADEVTTALDVETKIEIINFFSSWSPARRSSSIPVRASILSEPRSRTAAACRGEGFSPKAVKRALGELEPRRR